MSLSRYSQHLRQPLTRRCYSAIRSFQEEYDERKATSPYEANAFKRQRDMDDVSSSTGRDPRTAGNSSIPDVLLLSYIPPVGARLPSTGVREFFGHVKSAIFPTHHFAKELPFNVRMKEVMGQYMASKAIVDQARSFPGISDGSAENWAKETWILMNKAVASGQLHQPQIKSRLCQPLLSKLERNRLDLVSALPINSTLHWNVLKDSIEVKRVALQQREVRLNKILDQVCWRITSKQNLVAVDESGKVVFGDPNESREIIEYWVVQNRRWEAQQDDGRSWKMLMSVYEDTAPDWFIHQ